MLDEIREVFLQNNREFAMPEVAIFGRIGVAISGNLGFIKIAENEVLLCVKGGTLKVYGENLKIFNISNKDIGIFGDIWGVNYV